MRVKYKFRNGETIDVTYRNDEERWVTTKEENSPDGKGHHFLINENGDILKGFGGVFKNVKDIGKKIAEKVIATVESVVEVAKQMGIKLSESVKALRPNDVNKVLEVVGEMTEEFPQLKGYIEKMDLHSSGIMASNGKTLFFGTKHFSSSKGIEELKPDYEYNTKGWNENTDTPANPREDDGKWWFKNKTFEGTVAHECGHAIEHLLLDQKYPPTKTLGYYELQEYYRAWNKGAVSKEILSEACKNIKKTPYGKGKTNKVLVGLLSGYATKSPKETFAECFGDYFQNGENANPLSKEVVRITRERLNAIQ